MIMLKDSVVEVFFVLSIVVAIMLALLLFDELVNKLTVSPVSRYTARAGLCRLKIAHSILVFMHFL